LKLLLSNLFSSARRRVNQLEIDACRIRTDLARLEVANATGIVQAAGTPDKEQPVAPAAAGQPLNWQPVAGLIPDGMELLAGAMLSAEAPIEAEDSEQVAAEPVLAGESWVSGLVSRSRGMYRRTTSPVMASVVAHAAVMILAVSITVASMERNDAGLTTTTLVLGDKPSKESASFDPHQLADLGETGVQNAVADLPKLEAVATVDHDPIPIDFESIVSPAAPGKMGPSNSHDTEMGKVPSGVGGLAKDGQGTGIGLGGGKPGGVPMSSRNGNRLDSTLFFGTQARGNRFVFVVDNSSSMKGGRLEMAVGELVKTVEGLSARQSFYVIFVSDKPYPMFYPQQEPSLVPATPANKKRLAEWAPKAILASGKNRELIKAMDLAASLQPQAVYLLWDGDLRYSETVRLDVLTHLTEPNQWKFIVHTLGMGITSANSEQNLRTIAQAHSGTFRRIDVPASRTR
jgi:von Willebrand factor type A domain